MTKKSANLSVCLIGKNQWPANVVAILVEMVNGHAPPWATTLHNSSPPATTHTRHLQCWAYYHAKDFQKFINSVDSFVRPKPRFPYIAHMCMYIKVCGFFRNNVYHTTVGGISHCGSRSRNANRIMAIIMCRYVDMVLALSPLNSYWPPNLLAKNMGFGRTFACALWSTHSVWVCRYVAASRGSSERRSKRRGKRNHFYRSSLIRIN